MFLVMVLSVYVNHKTVSNVSVVVIYCYIIDVARLKGQILNILEDEHLSFEPAEMWTEQRGAGTLVCCISVSCFAVCRTLTSCICHVINHLV